ncbi:hypothetical protein ACIBIZ_44485 [Nonomuraea spiralis]|uniref:Uncharacterized protein n=1 Tax=Nonomuraea spiralis TaxID=46182 RepID=A0ABV5IE51_9ACTN|nr:MULTISPECIES: hypothetical protein [Nonomuraea]GGS68397.1 hypothetical protein GCM10010176_008500 [Nonomuraea spiralis]
MLTDEVSRRQPHEVHARGARPSPPEPRSEGRDDPAPVQAPARTVHRLRRIRQVSVQAIGEIDQALA